MNDFLGHAPTVARDVSVVLPIFNEEESLPAMIEMIHDALDPTGIDFEIVCIDDGSSDRTFDVLRRIASDDPRLVIGRFRRNFGQTAAMQAGIDRASGAVIVTMDADLQNDPRDIPAMIEKLDEGFDMDRFWSSTILETTLPPSYAAIMFNTTLFARDYLSDPKLSEVITSAWQPYLSDGVPLGVALWDTWVGQLLAGG